MISNPSVLNTSENWRLSIGVHRGTITSRESEVMSEHFDDPSKPLTSLEECRETAKKWEQQYRSLGCQIWYGRAISPDGFHTPVLQGVPYRN